MDKQKQIEEMAKDICVDCDFPTCTPSKVCDSWEYAENAINAGYRKIPENAVVLTREEYELFDSVKKGFPNDTSWLAEKYSEIGQTARNKTAEKFAEMVDETIAKRQGERDGYEAYRIDDKARYDGDIISLALYEICKEITEGKV